MPDTPSAPVSWSAVFDDWGTLNTEAVTPPSDMYARLEPPLVRGADVLRREYLEQMRASRSVSGDNDLLRVHYLRGMFPIIHRNLSYISPPLDEPNRIDFMFSYGAMQSLGGFAFSVEPNEYVEVADEPVAVSLLCGSCYRNESRLCEYRDMMTAKTPSRATAVWGCHCRSSSTPWMQRDFQNDDAYIDRLTDNSNYYGTSAYDVGLFMLSREACGDCINAPVCQARYTMPQDVTARQMFDAICELPDGHWSCYARPMPGLIGERNVGHMVPNPDNLPVGDCSRCGRTAPIYSGDGCSRQYNTTLEDAGGLSLVLCRSCLDNDVVYCDNCEQTIVPDCSSYTYNWRDNIICDRCADEEHLHCYECNSLIHRDDAWYDEDDEDGNRPMCRDCYRSRSERLASSGDYVHGYHSQSKTGKYFGTPSSHYIGIELEVENVNGSSVEQDIVTIKTFFEDGLLFFEYDGSLCDGYEIITAPMTPQYFEENKRGFSKMLSYLRAKGYRSHQTSTCGLHVHVSKTAFDGECGSMDNPKEVYEANLAKLLYIVEKFWPSMLKLCRRSRSALDSWAARYNVTDHDQLKEYAKNPRYLGRYRAINLTNPSTVEFRLWRGTLKDESFFATIDLVNALVYCAKEESVERIKKSRVLSALLGKSRMTPAMKSYFVRRGLSAGK